MKDTIENITSFSMFYYFTQSFIKGRSFYFTYQIQPCVFYSLPFVIAITS